MRLAWSHILFPIKTAATEAGKAFDLDQLTLASKDRVAIPAAVYDKIGPKGDNVAKEKLGPDTFWLNLKPLWPDDQPHLAVGEVAEWFASHAYLPKLRDRVVLDGAISDGVAKLDPAFGYADRFDQATGRYVGLAWAKSPPEVIPEAAVLVRSDAALEQLRASAPAVPPEGSPPQPGGIRDGAPSTSGDRAPSPKAAKPRRFYGTVEIDMVRPVKAFDAILNAVVMELQRNPATKVKVTLEIAAEAPEGFDERDIGVVRDNARQLKFKPDSTGFD